MTETPSLADALERTLADAPAATLYQYLARSRPELERTLRGVADVDRFLQSVINETRRTPALFDCTPESVVGAMLLAAQLELEPGPLGHVFLVPFENVATFVLGYRGIVELAYRSGIVRSIAASTVRDGDAFEWRYGTRPFLDHVPAGPPAEREPTAYYALASVKGGGAPFVVLFPDEIEATRARSPAGRAPESPWQTDYDAMARKTAIRRLGKVLPQTPALAVALERDEQPAFALEEPAPAPTNGGSDGDAG